MRGYAIVREMYSGWVPTFSSKFTAMTRIVKLKIIIKIVKYSNLKKNNRPAVNDSRMLHINLAT